MRAFWSSLFLALALTLTGCGSSTVADKPEPVVSTPAPESEAMNLEVNGDSDSLTAGPLRSVFFAFNSSALSDNAQEILEENAQFLIDNPSVEVQIEGHADERGGVQYNLALGERRAKSVKDYLVALGVDSSRITTISFGKERPIAFGHDEESWAKNRRANFVITAK